MYCTPAMARCKFHPIKIAEITVFCLTFPTRIRQSPPGQRSCPPRCIRLPLGLKKCSWEAAIKTRVWEPEFVRSVARIESNLRQDAVSNKGAIGLMQLMPGHGCGIGRRRS